VSLRTLHLLGSPVLREEAKPVARVDEEIKTLIKDLFDTMHASKGIGLAANQVGVAKRVAVVEAEDKDPLVLINPVIVEKSGYEKGEEGCLSIPDLYGDIERATRVVVETERLEGGRFQVTAEGLKARAIQHEIDHLDGILFLDRLSPMKRRLLMRKWEKQRKGEKGYLKEVTPAAVED
jgi:peptide deformylase